MTKLNIDFPKNSKVFLNFYGVKKSNCLRSHDRRTDRWTRERRSFRRCEDSFKIKKKRKEKKELNKLKMDLCNSDMERLMKTFVRKS